MEKILKMLEELSDHCKRNATSLWEDNIEDKSNCIYDDGQIESKIQNIKKAFELL
tara:strand:- start:1159 stop:1323 length:165 start_codon:yes stop_codon:yes gene_type:complete